MPDKKYYLKSSDNKTYILTDEIPIISDDQNPALIMDPMLARQVEKNMVKANDIENKLDIFIRGDGNISEDKDFIDHPSSYKTVTSYEIKSVSAIGLDKLTFEDKISDGFLNYSVDGEFYSPSNPSNNKEKTRVFEGIQYAYVHTYTPATPELNIKSYQQAFGINPKGYLVAAYRVEKSDSDEWGPWASGIAVNSGNINLKTPLITSSVIPNPYDQDPGDIWQEPIESVNI